MNALFSADSHTGAINLERVMWATDFPHGDGTYPHSRKVAEHVTEGMTEAQRQAVVYDNVAALYGLSAPA